MASSEDSESDTNSSTHTEELLIPPLPPPTLPSGPFLLTPSPILPPTMTSSPRSPSPIIIVIIIQHLFLRHISSHS